MPFGLPSLPGFQKEEHKQEASLDDILPNANQRVDLIVLVAVCTDHMRDCLTASFENQNNSESSTSQTGSKDFWAEEQDDKPEDPQTNRMDMQWARNLELSSTRMQGLKTSAVEHFNDWRSDVLRRMGEAMSVRVDAVKSGKAQYLANMRSAAQNQRDKEYYDWAEGGDKLAEAHEKGTKVILPFPRLTLPVTMQTMDEKKRALVLGSVLFMLLSLEHYQAQSRVLMSYLCQSLELPYDVLSSEETTTAATLLEVAHKSGMDGEEARKKQADQNAFGRKWKVGLATVAGAAVIGISGGLAAPLLLGVAGSIMGGVGLGGLATLLGATIANPVTIGALFGALGARMTGNAMDAYSKEVEDFKFLPTSEVTNIAANEKDQSKSAAPSHKLRVAIGISGWVTKESDVSLPWRVFSTTTLEPFALRYEQAALIALGTTLDNVLKNSAYSIAQSGAMQLVLPALSAALAPVGLLKYGQIIDNPFTIAMERSDKAGKVLAHALIDKCQGWRPVTLIGFSLGARVVFACLEELAAQNAFGLVENAILIGSPVPSADMAWRRMRTMVSGRLVNVYAQRDMLLGYLYRARNLTLGIAGLQAVSAPNVENKDVSSIVNGHNQYRLAIGRILKVLYFADLDFDQVEQENIELEHQKIHEKEIHEDAEREGRLKDFKDEKGQIAMGEAKDINEQGAERANSKVGQDDVIADKLQGTHLSEQQNPTLP